MTKKLLHPDQALTFLKKRFRNQCRNWLDGDGQWPLTLGLSGPTEQDFLSDPKSVQNWVAAWRHWPQPSQVTWAPRKWSRAGEQTLPENLVVPSFEAAACLVGEALWWTLATGRQNVLRARWPQLSDVRLGRFVDELAQFSDDDFERLLRAIAWFEANPASGHYLRQVPIEGLDTKWLEQNRNATLLVELLARVRRAETVERDLYTACGLTRKPARMRIKVLCPLLRRLCGSLSDIEAPVDELARVPLAPRLVLIVENLETGIALPDVEGAVAIIGQGNAITQIAKLPWLTGLPGIYWGDIDTYGLVILSRARKVLPKLVSVLMDEATLRANESLWGTEPTQHLDAELAELTTEERTLFDTLKSNRLGTNLRLEQERIAWGEAMAALSLSMQGLQTAAPADGNPRNT